jgi:hypothetical protein
MGILFSLVLAAVTIENRTLTADTATSRAIIDIRNQTQVRIRNVVIDGGRAARERPMPIPVNGTPFIDFYGMNGIAIDRSTDVIIEDVTLRNIPHLAIIVARSSNVILRRITVEDSGSRDARGRNNTTGGILLEEGTSRFEVRDCRLLRVSGNAIWTHSYSESPRNQDGLITGNEIDTTARDAIQIGHATRIRVTGNVMRNVGYPAALVDVENQGHPVGIDTAGNVDESEYAGNRMFEVNGKCLDLDGFHDGIISRNLCINAGPPSAYPNGNIAVLFNDSHPESISRNIRLANNVFDGIAYGGLFLYGSGHLIQGNSFLNLNTKRYAGDPAYLRAAVYVANGLVRPNPPRGIVLKDNVFTGHHIGRNCVVPAPDARGAAAKGIQLRNNRCENR